MSSCHSCLEVKSLNGYAGVFATAPLSEGDILLPIRGEVERQPSRYSIQIATDAHLAPVLDGAGSSSDGASAEAYTTWRFLNHSCDPNTGVDVEALVMVALRDIEAGEELTFNYNTTEWVMAAPFQCVCGAANCYGHIRGFKYLPADQQEALLPLAAPHIRRLVDAHIRAMQ